MIRVFNVANALPRLSLASIGMLRDVSTVANPLYFRATDVLLAEPLKKKRKIDPAVLRHREERKRRKIEKEIRRLEKYSKQLKPILEIQVPPKLVEEKNQRLRENPALSNDESERRALLQKEWTKYKSAQWLQDILTIDSVLCSQQKALDELRAESEELYNEAIMFDCKIVPYHALGPVNTPPIENYVNPDGEYIDVTRKYEGET